MSPALNILVVGAGPAGSSTALMLAKAGWRVGILHRRRSRPARTGETLPAQARSTLRALDLWSRFVADGHMPCPGIVSWWQADQPIEQDALFDPAGQAWHVDRERFDRMLLDSARAAGAEVVEDGRIIDAQYHDRGTHEGWRLHVRRSGQSCTLSARVLVIATGRANPVVPLRLARERLDRLIGLGAIVSATTTTAAARIDRRIGIEATANGWWYSAPMPDGRWMFTFFTDADQTPAREGRGPLADYWRTQLASAPHTSRRLDALDTSSAALAPATLKSSLQVIAADSYRTDPCQGPRWLAVGDAAAAWDPLSGQGLENAMRSGLRAARAIDALLRSADEGAQAWAAYARHEAQRAQHYRVHYASYYAQVRRWPDAPFWQRRRAWLD